MSESRRGARRRIALDPRLLIGAALVIASVAGVAALVGAADARVRVYAAVAPLSPGDRVDAGDLALRSVALDGVEERYLTSADLPADGVVVARPVAAGELVPLSAVGDVAGLRQTSLVIELTAPVSSVVEPGASIDVWSSAAGEQGFGPPRVLAAGATVVRLIEDEGFVVGATGGLAIELLVPTGRVARVLQAIAGGDVLAVVPAGLPLRRP